MYRRLIPHSTGALSPASTPVLLENWDDITASGNFLFVVNAKEVQVFRIDPNNGALTLAHSSPLNVNGLGTLPLVDRSGKFLYVVTTSDASQRMPASAIAAFLIDPSTGALSSVAGSPFSVPEQPGELITSAGPSR